MLAAIMMGGAVMTGLTACSNTDNNDGNNQQKRVALLLPDNSRIDRWGTDLRNLEGAMATYGIMTTSRNTSTTENWSSRVARRHSTT